MRPLLFLLPLLLLVSCAPSSSKEEKEKALLSDTINVNSATGTSQADSPGLLPLPDSTTIKFATVRIEHPRGDTFDLSIPVGFKLKIAAYGMNRIRFMDESPDGKLFLSDMFNLTDNSKGKIYVLSDQDDSLVFNKRNVYLENLRNPNSLMFHKDSQGRQWLYLALTDRLVRYAYQEGDTVPSASPEILDTYPDYGLSYRYGGWHLTRTIEFDDQGRLYVSVGSSCNVCVEKEEVRAAVLVMDENGKNRHVFAKGLRNAVGLAWAEGSLYATNMAADHLGKDQPDDAMFRVDEGKNYGWPYCYHWNGSVFADPKFDTAKFKVNPEDVPGAFSYLGAHTAPLGLAWFGTNEAADPALKNYFLVAQHGSYSPAIGRGYSLQRVRANHSPEDFVKGFLDEHGTVHGRPCGIMSAGKDRFYFTDDKFGTLYLIYK